MSFWCQTRRIIPQTGNWTASGSVRDLRPWKTVRSIVEIYERLEEISYRSMNQKIGFSTMDSIALACCSLRGGKTLLKQLLITGSNVMSDDSHLWVRTVNVRLQKPVMVAWGWTAELRLISSEDFSGVSRSQPSSKLLRLRSRSPPRLKSAVFGLGEVGWTTFMK